MPDTISVDFYKFFAILGQNAIWEFGISALFDEMVVRLLRSALGCFWIVVALQFAGRNCSCCCLCNLSQDVAVVAMTCCQIRIPLLDLFVIGVQIRVV